MTFGFVDLMPLVSLTKGLMDRVFAVVTSSPKISPGREGLFVVTIIDARS